MGNEIKITKEQFNEALKVITDYKAQLEKELAETKAILKKNSLFQHLKKDDLLMEVQFSPRLRNSLIEYFKRWNNPVTWQTTVEKLSEISISKISMQRHVGEKLLQELEEICMCAGIKMML